MSLFESLLALLAGIGVFITGMDFMSSSLRRVAGPELKKLLGKMTNNRFAGIGVGASVTAIIQSSSATTVMVVGFVNAGVMTLTQATSIIMGANFFLYFSTIFKTSSSFTAMTTTAPLLT